MKNKDEKPLNFVLNKFITEELVEEIIYRSDLYRIFEHVEHRHLELIADLALEELRIRALSGKLNPRALTPTQEDL